MTDETKTACVTCGRPTEHNDGFGKCNLCWEVTGRLPEFIAHASRSVLLSLAADVAAALAKLEVE